MNDQCTHCGYQLPDVRDGFCSECRQPLDEPPATRSPIQIGANQPSFTPGETGEAQRLIWEELAGEVRCGGRLVVFQYCVSVGFMTFLRASKVHLVRRGESTLAKGWAYTLLSFFAGWWGFPWGFIYTPLAIVGNLAGGKDVTASLVGHLLQRPLAEPDIAPQPVTVPNPESPSGFTTANKPLQSSGPASGITKE